MSTPPHGPVQGSQTRGSSHGSGQARSWPVAQSKQAAWTRVVSSSYRASSAPSRGSPRSPLAHNRTRRRSNAWFVNFFFGCSQKKELFFRVLDNPLDFGYSRISVLEMDFHPNRCSGRVRVLSSGFGFGCPDTPPDPNPTRCHPYVYPSRKQPRTRRAAAGSTKSNYKINCTIFELNYK